MSNASSSSQTPSSAQPSYSWKIQDFSTPAALAAPGPLETTWQTSSSSDGKTTGEKGALKSENTQPLESTAAAQKRQSAGKTSTQKRRRLCPEDEEIKRRIASAIAFNLATDHILALYPDTDTPFEDEIDVVNRLLPYHVFQYPRDDLNAMISHGKGKAKASPEDELREELRETKFAVDCYKRFRSLEKRFYNARIRAGEYASPHDQTIHLERMVAEGDRAAKTFLEQDLSAAKSELDKQLRAKRAAAQAASRQAAQAQAAQATSQLSATSSSSTTNFYGYSNKPVMSSLPGTSFSHYYSTYSYPYTQTMPYASSYQLSTGLARNPTPVSTLQPISNVGASSSAQIGANTNASSPTTTSTSNPTSQTSVPNSTTSTSTPQPTPTSTRPPVNIPLQIPVTSLPALRALGILPVPKAALPPPSDPQPAAVLIGSTAGGTMLSIEVNAALLQAPQMSGLAILLSGLVQTGGGNSATSSTASAVPTSQSTTTPMTSAVTSATQASSAQTSTKSS